MLAKHAANIIIATAMISVFLGIFFFTYASKVEQKIVVTRSTEIVDDLITTAKNAIPQDKKELIKIRYFKDEINKSKNQKYLIEIMTEQRKKITDFIIKDILTRYKKQHRRMNQN